MSEGLSEEDYYLELTKTLHRVNMHIKLSNSSAYHRGFIGKKSLLGDKNPNYEGALQEIMSAQLILNKILLTR